MLKRKKVKPITLRDVTIIDDGKLRKAITAASLGNAMEWFDFGVYGFVAYALGKVFFPGADPSVQMVAALATFSVPFLIRPLGGLFFGMLGDKYGRQKILAITIVIMSISTFCIGLIPSYDTIGIWAPILLLICKMAQGFSVGGEYTGASIFVAEYSPDRKRGFMGSWLDFGSIAGFVLGAGVVVLISTIVGEANFLDWGWRIPFLFGCLIVPFIFILRRKLEETQEFTARRHHLAMRQVFATLLANWQVVIAGMMMVAMTTTAFYLITVYAPTFGKKVLMLSASDSLLVTLLVAISNFFWLPVGGALSDRFGRRSVLIAMTLLALATAWPALTMLANAPSFLMMLSVLLWLSFIYGMYNGAMIPALTEIMPAEVRVAGFSLAYSLATAVFGGFTPVISTALIEYTGDKASPGYWMSFAAICGLLATCYLYRRSAVALQTAR